MGEVSNLAHFIYYFIFALSGVASAPFDTVSESRTVRTGFEERSRWAVLRENFDGYITLSFDYALQRQERAATLTSSRCPFGRKK